jgi:hypothetical protein
MSQLPHTELALAAPSPHAPTLPAPPPLKICACGRHYAADEWDRLPYVGVMRDAVEAVELRNCDGCASTIGIAVQ